MKPIFAALGRLAAISSIAFGIATVANYFNHRGYWYGTIFRVQTTDFNILSHTLPTKLSQALIQRNEAEIQRTLDSNYGLFGIVITNCTSVATNCPNQRILYKTRSQMRWSRELTLEGLRSAPFDYLRNPPPASAERGYENSRDTTWEPTGNANLGEIIGRVYYVRGIPPEFWADYSGWLGKLPASLLSDSGSHKYYTLTVSLFLSSGLAAWVFIERVLAQKRLQKRLAQQEEQRLLKEAEQLRNQLAIQLKRQERLLSELKYYRNKQEALSSSLVEKIAQCKDILKQKEVEKQNNIQNLKNLNHRLQEAQKQQVEGQEQFEKREQAIANLKAQIEIQQREQQQANESLKQLQHDLQITQQELVRSSKRIKSLDNSIISLAQERDLAIEQVRQLEYELQTVHSTQSAKITALTEALEAAGAESKRSQQLEQQAKELEEYAVQETEQLRQEKEQLSQEREQLSSKNEHLSQEKERLSKKLVQLQSQIQQLEEQLELCQARPFDLSNLTLALVGGQSNTRCHTIQELQSKYGLLSTNVVEIPPASERRTSQDQLRAKVANCTLVLIFTHQCDHALSKMLSNLQGRGALAGEVIHCSGRNDAISQIMQWAMDNPKLLRG